MVDRSDLHFDVVMSVKYHRRRAAFLERSSTLMSAMILLGGAGTFVSLFGQYDVLAKGLTAALTIVGVLQITFQPERCAAEHRGWLRRWMKLRREIEADPDPSSDKLVQWNNEKLDIESECVGEMRALQEDCYNRTVNELRCDSQQVEIRWWHRFLMQVYSFENGFQKA